MGGSRRGLFCNSWRAGFSSRGNLLLKGILTKKSHLACYCDVGFEDKSTIARTPFWKRPTRFSQRRFTRIRRSRESANRFARIGPSKSLQLRCTQPRTEQQESVVRVDELPILVDLHGHSLRTCPPPTGAKIPQKSGKEGLRVKKLPFPTTSEFESKNRHFPC